MQSAFDELASFTGALQLTPGNHPTERFDLHLTAPSRQPHARRTLDSRIATRRHHGFDFARTRVPVWSSDARCLVASDSVHPPMLESDAAFSVVRRGIEAWLGEVMTDGRQPVGVSTSLLETMYPGYVLGNGAEIETAMDIGVHLAVDVSHVFIQLSQGDMTERVPVHG